MEWWTAGEGLQYLMTNYPCEDYVAASRVLERMLEAGALQARRRTADGKMVSIAHSELRPSEPPLVAEHLLDAILGDIQKYPGATTFIEWDADVELSKWDLIEIEAAPLKEVCTPQPIATVPTPRDGRPPRPIVQRLLVLAGMWINENGVPEAGTGEQAALERFLVDQAAGQIKAELRIREIAKEAIGIVAAHRKAGK